MEKTPKIFFPENLKFLRRRKNLSQEELAAQMGITRVKLNALESGKTKNPAMEDLLKLSAFFRISIDSLLKAPLSRLLELQLRELEAGNDVYMMGTKLRVLPVTLDKEGRQNSEYVPVKARMGYRSGFNDPEYIAALPKYNIPTLSPHGTYRTFAVAGDSMYPIPDRAEITGEYVENWQAIKPDTPCVLILDAAEDMVFKLVTVDAPNHSFLLKSLNEAYRPYTVSAEDVLEIWAFRKLHLDELPENLSESREWQRVFLELKEEIRNLNK